MQAMKFLLGWVLAWATMGPSMADEEQPRLRVMTYNIHHGEGTDAKIDLERIAKLITENKVDLVALQEVDSSTERTGRRDMPAEFSRLTGMSNVFGSNLDLQGGHYGNAILSRFPIRSHTNYHLPKVVPGEQRGLLVTTISAPRGELSFCSVHLDHRSPEADRLASVERIQEIFSNNKSRLIIAGDFNARPESETYRKMKARFSDAWSELGKTDGFTIPSERPRSRIDYIWHSGMKPLSAKVLSSNASDHLPLLVDFEL